LIHAFNWKKLSVAATLAFRWDGRRSQLFFQTCPGSYNAPRLIAFLNDLKRHAPRRRLGLDLGWSAGAQEWRDERVPRPPAALADR
jgi:hypothetical protein